MKILFTDSETTGLPRYDLPADSPEQPRMVEIAAMLLHLDKEVNGRPWMDCYEAIIKPDGWAVDPKAASIHGITTEIAMEKGVPIAEAMDAVSALQDKAGLLACYNLRFDEKIRRGELRRLGRPDGFGTIRVFCVMRGVINICQLPKKTKGGKNQYKIPNLGEAVRHVLGREHEGHRAMADVVATRDLYMALKDNPEFIAAGSDFPSNKEAA